MVLVPILVILSETGWYVEFLTREFYRKLPAEKDLTLAKAKSLSFAMEAALKNSKEIQGSDVPLYRMANAKGKMENALDVALENMADVCPHKSKKCFHCKKIGHKTGMSSCTAKHFVRFKW